MVKAVFLDRDGTINKLIRGRTDPKHVGPWKFEEFEYIEGVPEAIKLIKHLGFTTHVVTNQPDVADKLMEFYELEQMHNKMKNDLNVDTIQFCSYRETLNYKPGVGMLENIIKGWNVTRERSWMIGDSWKDIVAGNNAGLNTIYLLNGTPRYSCPEKYDIIPDFFAENLLEAAKLIELEVR